MCFILKCMDNNAKPKPERLCGIEHRLCDCDFKDFKITEFKSHSYIREFGITDREMRRIERSKKRLMKKKCAIIYKTIKGKG